LKILKLNFEDGTEKEFRNVINKTKPNTAGKPKNEEIPEGDLLESG
jgi:hypothetical protein